jgi:hypothetical protein
MSLFRRWLLRDFLVVLSSRVLATTKEIIVFVNDVTEKGDCWHCVELNCIALKRGKSILCCAAGGCVYSNSEVQVDNVLQLGRRSHGNDQNDGAQPNINVISHRCVRPPVRHGCAAGSQAIQY